MQPKAKQILDFRKVIEKQRWNEFDARSVLSAFESSDMSLVDFCHEYRLQTHRVAEWERKLRSKTEFGDEKPFMVPLRVMDKQKREEPSPWLMEVEFNNIRVRLSEGVTEAFLTRTLRLLKEISC